MDLFYRVIGQNIEFSASLPFKSMGSVVGKIPGGTKFKVDFFQGPTVSTQEILGGTPLKYSRYRGTWWDTSSTDEFVLVADDNGPDSLDFYPVSGKSYRELESDYLYRMYLMSSGTGRRTRKYIPGHRYLAGDIPVIFLGSSKSIATGKTSNIYMHAALLGTQTKLSEVLHSIQYCYDVIPNDFSRTLQGYHVSDDTGKLTAIASLTSPNLIDLGKVLENDVPGNIRPIFDTWLSRVSGRTPSSIAKFFALFALFIGDIPGPWKEASGTLTEALIEGIYKDPINRRGISLESIRERVHELIPDRSPEGYDDKGAADKLLEVLGIDVEAVYQGVSDRLGGRAVSYSRVPVLSDLVDLGKEGNHE